MLVCYLGLILYFRSKGGYKPQIIISEKEEELLMTGGAVGPGRHVTGRPGLRSSDLRRGARGRV